MPTTRRAEGPRRRIGLTKRTITFFEVLDGFLNRIPPIDWPDVLTVIAGLDTDTDARFEAQGGMRLHGRVFSGTSGPDLLILSRTRSNGRG